MTFSGRYLDWNQKRVKGIVDYYGHKFLFQKKVLDLGCGHADISGVLYRLGSDITALDARQEHLKVASKKYPGIKTVKADLDQAWPFSGKLFDIILDLDILCHLQNYEEHIKSICASSNFIVLETAVCDSDDPYKCIPVPENKSIYDLAANGYGCRPSSAAIERVLTQNGFEFSRQDYSKYNSGSYVYDWQPQNNDSIDPSKRRIWFAVRNSAAVQFTAPDPPPVITNPLNSINGFVPTLQETPFSVYHKQTNIIKPLSFEKSKLKTAVCISGHLRTFETNYKSVLDHVLNKMDCDIFIHTWDTLGLDYRHLDCNLQPIEIHKLAEKIQSLYSPKKLIIEPNKPFHVTPLMQSRLIDHRDIPGILSMFYKIEACNNIKKDYENANNFKYDCVIRFRGDIWMENPLPIDDKSNLNYLFLPLYGNFGGSCDQIAYGSSSVMDTYASLYSNVTKYLEMGAPMHPEKILRFHIDINRIPIAQVNMKFLIKRSNGLVQDNMLLERALGFIR